MASPGTARSRVTIGPSVPTWSPATRNAGSGQRLEATAGRRRARARDANEPAHSISHRLLLQRSGVTIMLTTTAASAFRDPDNHRLRKPMAPPDRRRSNGQLENAELTTQQTR